MFYFADVAAEKPTIIPKKDELEIREGTELKIDCYSKESPVHFSFPNSTFMASTTFFILKIRKYSRIQEMK